jgi:hypothetical protein
MPNIEPRAVNPYTGHNSIPYLTVGGPQARPRSTKT